ncbi:MAG: SMI1/KNR4 family protein [Polyangiaceae bacterium]|nr:SMI1/KNR4 family protein [Polyangiaceae bacterium]
MPAFLDYIQPPLTDEAVTAAEDQLGVKLPEAYVDLLRQQNGGYLRARWPESASKRLFGIGPRYPSITVDQAWWRPKKAEPDIWTPPRPELLIPFDGDGHWSMCFDYRGRGPRAEPSVTLIDCECEREEAIAGTFVAYLAGLVDEIAEASTRIYGDVSPEAVARAIARSLAAAPPTVDTFAHGYPTWRIALPGRYQWCWCSANRVPAGFRREGKRAVVTEETALRIPEDPGCAVLLSCTEASRATVSAALTALGLAMIPRPGGPG